MTEAINDYISYIPSSEVPISGEVGIIYGKKTTYLYDVGSTRECLDFLYSLNGRMQIIISHFHGDHTWWLTKHRAGEKGMLPGDTLSLTYEPVKYEKLYIGKSTEKYLPDGQIVMEPVIIEDETPSGLPLKLEIIPMPSSHTKGSLALVVNDEYVFMGDATYCKYIAEGEDGYAEYNVQKLKEQIDVLKSLKAEKCLVSHEKRFERPLKVVIRQLESIYARRLPGENGIKLVKQQG
jgi:glyoxylase-like metal-dependent hydrolase (beta-lactamase superfamily II)